MHNDLRYTISNWKAFRGNLETLRSLNLGGVRHSPEAIIQATVETRNKVVWQEDDSIQIHSHQLHFGQVLSIDQSHRRTVCVDDDQIVNGFLIKQIQRLDCQ